jgi:hypothetical protein
MLRKDDSNGKLCKSKKYSKGRAQSSQEMMSIKKREQSRLKRISNSEFICMFIYVCSYHLNILMWNNLNMTAYNAATKIEETEALLQLN